MRVGPVSADRRRDLVVANERDTGRAFGDDFEGLLVGDPGRHAVGKRVGARGRHDVAGGEGQRIGRRRGGLDANDLGPEPQRVASRDAAADPRALADRDVEHVEVGVLAHEFEGVGRHAERETAVKGGDHVQPALVREPRGLLARGLEILAVLDQLGSERPHGGVLLARIAVRRDDRDEEAEAPSGEGEALPVVAARRRD